MKSTLSLLIVLFLSPYSFAKAQLLNEEAQTAIYHLSKCTPQISEMVTQGRWIHNSTRWEAPNKNYGYQFFVFERDGFTSTRRIGKIELEAIYIPNPPADGSSYRFVCSVEYDIAR